MATYQYEQLDDESFQQLSQSLLLKSFPGLQCFPVGQPDGGRDAIVRRFGSPPDTSKFVLCQVKFSRHKLSPSEALKWLKNTLRDELPKIQRQISEGAERFVLVTNAPGSAHQGTGSIDKLQALLEENIPIPAEAWWRDDLDRRLDNAWDLKFAHPALFSGNDLLRLVIEASSEEGCERRLNAITAFLSGQYESDREVKFKQAELQNDIFDLFTDVPLMPRTHPESRQIFDERLVTAFRRVVATASGDVDLRTTNQWIDFALGGENKRGRLYSHEETWLGAASLLLDSDFQQAEPLVILEGAPGQGKSTIAQYICQVHRMRILDRQGDEPTHPTVTNSSVRLPFKVELRDFANWLSGGNPFSRATESDELVSTHRSLEGFLAALVHYESGGSEFNVSDLQSTLKLSSTLIVLDGLDEVPDLTQREQVVKEIIASVSRLRDLAMSLQVVVTSRPTPFMNSTILPRRTFATYSLESLPRPLVIDYAQGWLQSREIDEDSANEVRHILNEKLNEPHLRELARNPMQLAILLSLIHRRGVSLPEKRTALYDNYVEMFFDRESEKAAVVKENRDLLIRIHRYLAWILQSEAEVSPESTLQQNQSSISLSGRIKEEDLKKLVRGFLKRDEIDTSLVDELFGGMVERVVAIVSRVEGFYEFDVQTLREYFAARYLYETAPYSPPGDECPGTRSDRWRALSRNYYWLNVARFYAGCYSEGEAPSLVDGLRDLSADEIFSLYQPSTTPGCYAARRLGVLPGTTARHKMPLTCLSNRVGCECLSLARWAGRRRVEDVFVRDPNGRTRLMTASKDLLESHLHVEQAIEIVWSIFRPNANRQELNDWWTSELSSANNSRVGYWCIVGENLHCWTIMDLDTVKELLASDEIPTSDIIVALLHANRMDIFENSEEFFNKAVEAVLSGELTHYYDTDSLLQQFIWSLDSLYFGMLRPRGTEWVSLIDRMKRFRGDQRDLEDITYPQYDAAESCARVVQVFNNEAERPIVEWNTSIEPWDRIVQCGVTEFGEHVRFAELANLAAGIRSSEQTCKDCPDLFDRDRSLVRRFRYARLRAGSRKWWSDQLRAASGTDEVWIALLLFATWAGSKTTEAMAEVFDQFVVSLDTVEWRRLHSALQRAVNVNSSRSSNGPLEIVVDELPASLNVRTVTLLAVRCTQDRVDDLFERYLSDYDGDDPIVVSLCTDVLVRRPLMMKRDGLELLKACDSVTV